jgi:hypothetical protein
MDLRWYHGSAILHTRNRRTHHCTPAGQSPFNGEPDLDVTQGPRVCLTAHRPPRLNSQYI